MNLLKRTLFLIGSSLALVFTSDLSRGQNVAINTSGNPANPNAILDISSTNLGLLIPRMTTAQRTTFGGGLGAAEEGMTVYDTDTDSYWLWDGAAWIEFDMDATNEFNTSLSLSNDTLYLTDGGGTLSQYMGSGGADGDWTVSGIDQYSAVSGKVGIGTPTPIHKLHVVETADSNHMAIFGHASQNSTTLDQINVGVFGEGNGSGGNGISFGVLGYSDPDSGFISAGVFGYLGKDRPSAWTSYNRHAAVYGDANGKGYSGVFMNGNFGIGDPSPDSKLDVNGRAYIEGDGDAFTNQPVEYDLVIDDSDPGGNTGFEVPGNDTLTFIAGGAEQVRVFPDGVMAVNTTAAIGNQTLYSVATGNDNAVTGIVGGSGAAVNGQSLGGTGPGVYGHAENDQTFGVNADNTTTDGTALIATGNNLSGTYLLAGSGASLKGNRFGAIGWGDSTEAGIGLFGAGNGKGVQSPNAGAGVAANAKVFGVYALADSVPGGVGVSGAGNGVGPTILTNGSGVAGTGEHFGTYGIATSTNTAGTNFGGYFENNGTYAYVGGWNAGTDYKIVGVGTVSTIVEDEEGEDVTMFAPEAPEVLFEDYGSGKLENGEARIQLDPTWAKNVSIDEEHPLRVFIQLEGNCKGVYVTDKSKEGFTVKELQGGDSDVPFTYKVVANRKDAYRKGDDGERIKSEYDDLRFPDAPEKQDSRKAESSSMESGKAEKEPRLDKEE